MGNDIKKPSRIKRIAVVGGTTIALVGGGAAFAYWTTSGSGTGSASTGTSSAFGVQVEQVNLTDLTPGGPTDTVHFTVSNNNSGAQRLQAVVAKVGTADGTDWSVTGCSTADFTVSAPAFTAGDIASGGSTSGTFTIQMVNSTSNQDGCKGVTVPLYVSAS